MKNEPADLSRISLNLILNEAKNEFTHLKNAQTSVGL